MNCAAGCGTELAGNRRKWCSDQCSKDSARAARLDAVFNITPDEYEQILTAQESKCAICRREPKPGKRLAVDHDHETGFIRGLLCYPCNKRVLGARSARVLLATARYIESPPARRVIGDRVAPGRPPPRRTTRRRRRTS